MTRVLILVLWLCPVSVQAQEPVVQWADWTSYATAAVNPTIATVQAFRSADPKCRLGQLAIAEAIGNGTALTIKHFVNSPRPCLGCPPDGMPSGHSANSMIGASWNWNLSLTFGVTTAGLRRQANRHTTPQVLAGLALGAFSEWAGHKLLTCHD